MRTMKMCKPYTQMTADELAKATAEFDKEFSIAGFGPPPPEAKAIWEQMKRKRGRPARGEGAKIIAVSLEKGLLARSDRFARKHGITRSALIARGLEAVLNHRFDK